eukprot:12564515-Alexandrium_andersonii.AAC.1
MAGEGADREKMEGEDAYEHCRREDALAEKRLRDELDDGDGARIEQYEQFVHSWIANRAAGMNGTEADLRCRA